MRRVLVVGLVLLNGLALAISLPCVCAETTTSLSKSDLIQFNRLLEKQRHRDARWFYNKGTLAVLEKQWDAAIEALHQALLSDDPALQQKAHYNLANAYAFKAKDLYHKDLNEALTTLDRAVYHAKRALELNPKDEKARHNLAVLQAIRERWRKAQQQSQTQPSGQRKQSASSQQKNQLSQSSKEAVRQQQNRQASNTQQKASSKDQSIASGKQDKQDASNGQSLSVQSGQGQEQQNQESGMKNAQSQEPPSEHRDKSTSSQVTYDQASHEKAAQNKTLSNGDDMQRTGSLNNKQHSMPRPSFEDEPQGTQGSWSLADKNMQNNSREQPVGSQTTRSGLNEKEAAILMKRYLSEKGEEGWLWFVVPQNKNGAVEKDW